MTDGSSDLRPILQAVSAALHDPGNRRVFVQALRRSPYVNHRISLTELLGEPQMGQFRKQMAVALGIDASVLTTELQAVGPLDVLVPLSIDRQRWTGSDDVIVFAPSTGPAAVGFSSFGHQASFQKGRRIPGMVQIAVTASRPKHLRVNRSSFTPGPVIEDPGEEQFGGMFTAQLSPERTVSVQLADLYDGTVAPMQDCYENCGGGPGGGEWTHPPDTTFLEKVRNNIGDCYAYSELSFLATYYRNGTAFRTGRIDYEWGDLASGLLLTKHDILIFSRPLQGSGERIAVDVYERDSGLCGDDDYLGQRSWFDYLNGGHQNIGWTGAEFLEFSLRWTPKYSM